MAGKRQEAVVRRKGQIRRFRTPKLSFKFSERRCRPLENSAISALAQLDMGVVTVGKSATDTGRRSMRADNELRCRPKTGVAVHDKPLAARDSHYARLGSAAVSPARHDSWGDSEQVTSRR